MGVRTNASQVRSDKAFRQSYKMANTDSCKLELSAIIESQLLKIAHPTHSGSVADFEHVVWPPTAGNWKDHMWAALHQVSSYNSFVNAMVNVCWVATRYFSKLRGVPAAQLDPRRLYEQEHMGTMGLIRRELGTSVRQVEAITMREARNATQYADIMSVRGVAMCAAFAMGALMSGRRPRSLTAIRLQDVKLTVGACEVHGRIVKVPHVQVTFTDEKFMDLQGPRKATDKPSHGIWITFGTVLPIGSTAC